MKISKTGFLQTLSGAGLAIPVLFPLVIANIILSRANMRTYLAASIGVMPFLFVIFDILVAIGNSVSLPTHSFLLQAFYLSLFFLGAISTSVRPFLKPYVIVIPILALVGFFAEAPVTAMMANIRSLLIFPVSLIVFTNLNICEKITIRNTLVVFMTTSFLINLLAILYFNLQNNYIHFFDLVGYDLLYIERNFEWEGEFPIGFRAFDFFSGEYTIRHVGLFSSPDKFAYLTLVVIFFVYAKVRSTLVLLLGLVLLLILHVKILVFFLLMFLLLKHTRFLHRGSFNVILSGLITSIVCGIILILNFDLPGLSKSGALHHLWGFYTPFLNSTEYTMLFGNGLGSGGTIGRTGISSEISKAELGGESFIGSVFFQGGLLLLISLIVVFRTIFLSLQKINAEVSYIIPAVLGCYVMSEAPASFFQSFCFVAIIVLLYPCKVEKEL